MNIYRGLAFGVVIAAVARAVIMRHRRRRQERIWLAARVTQ